MRLPRAPKKLPLQHLGKLLRASGWEQLELPATLWSYLDALEQLPRFEEMEELCTSLTGLSLIREEQHLRVLDYEAQVADGRLPTRPNNLHDFLNILTWLAFPQLKKAITESLCNMHKDKAISDPQRRAFVHFDENGAILQGTHVHALSDLQNHHWEEAAKSIESFNLIIVGHGLLEKLMQPYSGITAHTFLVEFVNTGANTEDVSITQRNTLNLNAISQELSKITSPRDLATIPVELFNAFRQMTKLDGYPQEIFRAIPPARQKSTIFRVPDQRNTKEE